MHTITPLSQASRQTVIGMAETAVNNSVPLDEANVFEPGTDQCRWFRTAYLKYETALEAVD